MYIAEKDATSQCSVCLAESCSDQERLLRAGDATADQDQESTWVDRSATKQRDRRSLDHEVARQDAGGYSLEFQ